MSAVHLVAKREPSKVVMKAETMVGSRGLLMVESWVGKKAAEKVVHLE